MFARPEPCRREGKEHLSSGVRAGRGGGVAADWKVGMAARELARVRGAAQHRDSSGVVVPGVRRELVVGHEGHKAGTADLLLAQVVHLPALPLLNQSLVTTLNLLSRHVHAGPFACAHVFPTSVRPSVFPPSLTHTHTHRKTHPDTHNIDKRKDKESLRILHTETREWKAKATEVP